MIIAEIGINHNGDLEVAKEMIRKSKEHGADIVKFQKRNVRKIVPKDKWDNPRETPWGTIPYIEYKEKLEFGKEEYDEIDRYCKEIGIAWTASAWDVDSVDFLMQYDIPFIKVASATITDEEMLYKIGKSSLQHNKGIIMSTGGSTYEEIFNAYEKLKHRLLCVMHCNSTYPANNNELNLNRISTLKGLFKNVDIGYSGHEEGIFPSIIAYTMGAIIIERHVTLDKAMYGSDQKASITFEELKELVEKIKDVDIIKGSYNIKVNDSEIKVMENLRHKKEKKNV